MMSADTLKNRTLNYALLMRFDRPIGIYLLLWPALWALWIAGQGQPSLQNTFIFIMGVILMRAAGCVINDFADRNIDPFVKRTEHRPLATGAVSAKEAIALFVTLGLIAFLLVLFTNWLTFGLSFAALFLAVLYPFTKRYTYMPQAFLGLAFGWAVPMAFAAETGSVPLVAWLILTATVLWATAYDTMYAMVDRDDDIRIGVKSTAILFGDSDVMIIGAIQVLFFITLLIVGNKLQLSAYYYAGVLVATGFAVYQQYLIREREPGQCLKAFLNNNWVGAAVFVGIVLHYMLGS
jgi:4-hydroxybenzoate polyprenyltransferase